MKFIITYTIHEPTIIPKYSGRHKSTESQNLYFYNLLLIIDLYFSCFCVSVASFYLSPFLERTHSLKSFNHART
jgi:hypothetical protein